MDRVLGPERDGTKRLTEKIYNQELIDGDDFIILWKCISAKRTSNLHIIDGIMNKFVRLNLLKNNLKVSDEKFRSSKDFNFHRDNNPKFKFQLIRQWLIFNIPHIITTLAKFPDFNRIEYQ